MKKCRWIPNVERWFDKESVASDVRGHIESCPVCARHLDQLCAFRQAAHAARGAEIGDAQFPAFMAGIRERVETPAPTRRRGWRVAWVTMAALLVASAAFLVMTDGTRTVEATVVESYSSELEGAIVTTYASDTGVTTLLVQVSQDDETEGGHW